MREAMNPAAGFSLPAVSDFRRLPASDSSAESLDGFAHSAEPDESEPDFGLSSLPFARFYLKLQSLSS